MADQIQNSKKIKHDDIHVVLEAELNKEEKGNKIDFDFIDMKIFCDINSTTYTLIIMFYFKL
jgi:hypothetical protein